MDWTQSVPLFVQHHVTPCVSHPHISASTRVLILSLAIDSSATMYPLLSFFLIPPKSSSVSLPAQVTATMRSHRLHPVGHRHRHRHAHAATASLNSHESTPRVPVQTMLALCNREAQPRQRGGGVVRPGSRSDDARGSRHGREWNFGRRD